ncbi:MAG: selenocysteine-specific translation elongation factor [Deltaproteobacteria bacterium]|nr:selenocysteine-specific translation elongation factor [Deltaproteobacteria bacterium]
MTTRHAVVGTAGHIDHGKTTLVKRLTGVDTDRLPEEQRRGITIVLGFAPLTLPDGTRVGLVDVPGHERFVKTMVAGAGGLDLVLLVVAADEGVMPQTREHLEICGLLGIERGVVALTKIDRAGRELTELATEDVRELLEGTALEGAPIVPCSAVTGEGIDALLQAIATPLAAMPERRPDPLTSLPIDRVFTVKGFGTVVTGTLRSGTLAPGELVEVLPAIAGRPIEGPARIRGIEVFRQKVERAFAGDRVALNLSADLDQLTPGQLIVTPGTARASRLFDLELRYLASREKALKTGAQVILHIGTAQAEARLTLLDADRLEPGASSWVRARLKAPLAALPGERFIVRGFDGPGGGRTIGGGLVLDPEPVRRRRHDPKTREVLEQLRHHLQARSPEARVAAAVALIAERGARGLAVSTLARRLGVDAAQARTIVERAARERSVALLEDLAVHLEAIHLLGERVLAIVDAFHREHPYRPAIALGELATRVGRAVNPAVVERASRALVGMKKLAPDADGFRRPDHFGVSDAVRDRVRRLFEEAGLEPPSLEAAAKSLGLEERAFREVVALMTKSGELVRASPEICLAKKSFDGARDRVIAHLQERGELTAQDAKALLGLSRKYLIPLLEALDKAQVTVRVGEVRKAARKPAV